MRGPENPIFLVILTERGTLLVSQTPPNEPATAGFPPYVIFASKTREDADLFALKKSAETGIPIVPEPGSPIANITTSIQDSRSDAPCLRA